MKKKCLECSKDFKNRPKVKFCSPECNIIYKQRLRVKSGKIDYRTIRRYLLRTQGNTCSICKLSIWQEKQIPLVLDHKDGNSYNNNEDNCRLVCCNCDALLPTYKGRNRGNGRHLRKLRYQQGKSY